MRMIKCCFKSVYLLKERDYQRGKENPLFLYNIGFHAKMRNFISESKSPLLHCKHYSNIFIQIRAMNSKSLMYLCKYTENSSKHLNSKNNHDSGRLYKLF